MKRVAFLLFMAGWGANHFVALLPLYRSALALSPAEVSILFGVYALGLVPSLVLRGPMSDRWGRRAVTSPATVITLAGSSLLAASASSFSGLWVGRLIVGLGSGAVFSAGSAWLVDQTKRSSIATMALSGGFGMGPLVAGALACARVYPLVAAYLLQIAITASVAVFIFISPIRPISAVAIELSLVNDRSPLGSWKTALSAPWVFVFPSFAMVILPATATTSMTPSKVAMFAGACAASTLFVGTMAQRSTTTMRATTQSRIGLVVGAAGLLVGAIAVHANSAFGIFAACPFLGTGHGLTFASGLRSTMARAEPATRGRAVGVFYVLAYVGFAVPFGFVFLTHVVTQTNAFVCVSIAALLVAVVPSHQHSAGGKKGGRRKESAAREEASLRTRPW